MTQCQQCERKCDLYLCATCSRDLHEKLIELPRFMSYLGDTALHHTRGAGAERRSSGYESRLPFDLDTESGRRSRQERAANLFGAITNGLAVIVRDLCESRGKKFRAVRIVNPKFIGPLQRNQMRGPDWLKEFENWSGEWIGRHATAAWWLAHHMASVAADESAGDIYSEIERYVSEIDRLINPPIPMRWIGKCPTVFKEEGKTCDHELKAREDAEEVTCRKCRQTYRVDWIKLLAARELEHKKLTIDELLNYMRKFLPEEYRVPERTLRHWRQIEKLKPRGWRRPDGRIGITQHSDEDEPLYVWSDVHKLRMEKRKVKA